ncbi:FAD-binding oxidoreductase [Streptomyces sp. B6B3]|uniref:FAD-binding oxidoreductase n=1 Tax=Streptomyces sp. B6B3 TaxID=3153570 RepID=UPI00325CC284
MDSFSGPVFARGADGYDAERAPLNRALEQRPDLVVGAARPEDVAAAVALAGDTGRSVAVMATGHGPSVSADGHVLITTRRLDGVRVDPVARTAVVGAGARWGDVLPRTTPHDLAPLNGSSPNVGAVGYTLGGGVGLLGRRFGYAADHVRRLDVVTADGRLRRVTAESDPDLFWALRGGKGNFGVVTEMEIDLFPVPRLFGGGLYFGGATGAAALRAYVPWAVEAPEEMSSSVLLMRYPDHPSAPEPLRGAFVTHVRIAYSGPVERGAQLVEPLRAVGPRLLDTVTGLPYERVGSIHHEPVDEPYAAFDAGVTLDRMDQAGVDTLLALAGPEADAPFLVELRHHGGAYAVPPAVPNAVGARDAAFTLFCATGPDESDRRAQRKLVDAMLPWGAGALFLNFAGIDQATPDHVRSAYRPADYARLADLKHRLDPANLFRVNLNIPPTSPEP